MEDLEKEFVPCELAMKLKALGFNRPCLFLYNSSDDTPKPFLASPPEPMDWNTLYVVRTNDHLLSAPTFSQAFRWFRDDHRLDSFCRQLTSDGTSYYRINKLEPDERIKGYSDFTKTYEDAELKCLAKLIQMVEGKKD